MNDELGELISELGIICDRAGDGVMLDYVEIDEVDLLPLLKELRRLRALAAKLPTTKDGQPVVLNRNLVAMVKVNETPRVLAPVKCEFVSMGECGGTVRDINGDEYDVDYEDCYSTPEAAREAK